MMDEKWLVEYEQAGEEVRYRDRILHNSYYLLVISFAAFSGSALNLANRDEPFFIGIILLSVFAAGAFAFLAIVLYVYNEKRIIAMFRRQQIGNVLRGLNIQRATHPNFHREIQNFTRSGEIKSVGPYLICVIVSIGSGGWFVIAITLGVWQFLNQSLIVSFSFAMVVSLSFIIVFIKKILPNTHPNREECLKELAQVSV